MKLKCRFLFLTLLTLAQTSFAMNALRGKSFNSLCPKAQKSRDSVSIPEKVEGRKSFLNNENLASVLPNNLQGNETGQQMSEMILKKSAESLLKSPLLTQTRLFRAAKTVEQSTQMGVAVKGKRSPGSKESIDHNFKFDIQALDTKARIRYQGLVDSKIEYQASNSSLVFSLEEALSNESKIAFSYLEDPEQSRQLIQYQISW